jgi:hypothetical protein
VLTSFVTYNGRTSIIRYGDSKYSSLNPLKVHAGSTSVIYIVELQSRRMLTVIGRWVNNVYHMGQGQDHRPLPYGVDTNTIDNLRLRRPIKVEDAELPPGNYEFTLTTIIDQETFSEYCEDDIQGTNAQLCGRIGGIREDVQRRRYEQQLEWYLFHVSISLTIHVVIIILIIIILFVILRRER